MKKKRWFVKVRNTLPHFNRRDVMTFSIFLCLSAFFWIVQTANQANDDTYRVRLIIEGQPASAVFTTPIVSELQVTLYDRNLRLMNYHYRKEIRTLVVDFNRYADAAGNFRISGAELQSLLLNKLNSSTQITAVSPALIDAKYALTQGKRVPVRLSGELRAAMNHHLYPVRLTPDSVLVHAPNYMLDTLNCVFTEPVYSYGLKDTLSQMLALRLSVGMKTTPDSIQLHAPVVQYVEKNLGSLPIQITDLPLGKSLVLFPRQANVRLMAAFHKYAAISAADFRLSVSYHDILASQQRLPIHCASSLDSTCYFNLTLSPDSVEFIIEEHKL